MKKTLTSVVTLALLSLSLTGCGNKGKKIHLQLVPSNDPAALMTRAKALAPILDKYAPGYSFSIDVGASYAATTTALAAGQIDGGFLTASGYAQRTIEQPGAVSLLLSAGRAGYKVQADDYKGSDEAAREIQRKHRNGADGYVYRGEQSKTLVNFYCSVVFTLKDSERTALSKPTLDKDGDGEISLAERHDGNAVWGTRGATSSAGYIYPTKYLYDKGYTKGFFDKAAYDKLSDADKKLARINATQKSYPEMVDNLRNGVIDVAVGFFDIRYGSAFVQTDSKYHNDESVFTKTYTAAVLDPIRNDTVCAYGKLEDDKKEAIKKALKGAVQDGSIHDNGIKKGEKGASETDYDLDNDGQPSGAYLLYQIYSHTSYIDGKDSDYDAARDRYRWTNEHAGK